MRVQNYYLIRPKNHLLSAEGIDELSHDVLSRAHLWVSPEGGKTMWASSDYVARAKLAFLINLRLEYVGSTGVERLFEGSDISLRLFDKHWDMEVLELDGDVAEISGVDLSGYVVEQTGMPNVDDWLSSVVEIAPAP